MQSLAETEQQLEDHIAAVVASQRDHAEMAERIAQTAEEVSWASSNPWRRVLALSRR